MKRYDEQVAQRTEVDAQLQKKINQLNEDIEKAKKTIAKGETLVGRLYDARELNGRILSHYNYLNAVDSDDRQKVLKYDLDDYVILEEIVKHLEDQ